MTRTVTYYPAAGAVSVNTWYEFDIILDSGYGQETL